VIGGKVADPKHWPATFVFRTPAGGCTATAVGSQVLLTAAHCVTNGGTGSISAGNTMSGKVTCAHHPSYPADISADFALCSTDKPLPAPADGFETVNTASDHLPALKQDTILLGYGCTASQGVDRSFGILHWGTAQVAERRHDLYIRTSGGAAVCFGDSGGGAYYLANPSGSIRRLFGVNSRGDISTNSFISATANNSFRGWATSWSAAAKAGICGLNADGQASCRQ
jgi:hypothetical protein